MKVLFFKNSKGKEPFNVWLNGLKDEQVITRIQDRIDRIITSRSLGDCKHIEDKIYELRFHFGPGYRIYFSAMEDGIFILCGGDKSSQKSDIIKARKFLEESENV